MLVIAAETLSRHMDWTDRNTCVLFGDGAGRPWWRRARRAPSRGIVATYIRSDGSGARLLERTAGGSRFPFDPRTTLLQDTYLKMDGRQVYNFAVRVIIETIQLLLERDRLTMDQIATSCPTRPTCASSRPPPSARRSPWRSST